jgi:hypothetical protein
MRTFDAAPVVCLQSNQHRIELPPVIKRLSFQLISYCKLEFAKNMRNRHSFD